MANRRFENVGCAGRRATTRRARLAGAALIGIGLWACGGGPRDAAADSALARVAGVWEPPADARMPPVSDSLGVAIRRGQALLAATRDSLPGHVGNALRCNSCHMDEGRRPNGLMLAGVYARFPQYRSRNAAISTIEDRVNDCFERSLNGRPLDPSSRDMRDIVAWLAFLSGGAPVGKAMPGQGLPKMTPLATDTARGAQVIATVCYRCHGGDGLGTSLAPPLWGPKSFNIGAGMERLRTAASFIRHNMPFDQPGTLTDQQAFDVAAWITSRPRPDFAGKENDWPNGDAPADVAYPTRAGRAKSKAGPGAR